MAKAPDIHKLRSFVRGQLNDEEAFDIYHWMVLCTAPELPNVLHNLQFEWEQEQSDDLLEVAQQKLGKFFLELWEQGRGEFDAFSQAPVEQSYLMYADALRGEGSAEGIRLLRVDDGKGDVEERQFNIEIFVAPARVRVAAILTTDSGKLEVFFRESPGPGTEVRQVGPTETYTFDKSDGRGTFWYVASDDASSFGIGPPTTLDLLEPWLRSQAASDAGFVCATRLTPRVLTDFFE